MDIALFRATKERLLASLSAEHRALAETHIQYTLNILQQETMSREAIAIIITYTKDMYERPHTTVD